MTAMPMTFEKQHSEEHQTVQRDHRDRADEATVRGRDRQGKAPTAESRSEGRQSPPDEAYLRLMADFENYKRHAERRIADAKEEGTDEMVRRLAPILADIEKAAEASGQDVESMRRGVEMVARKLENLLASLGYERISTIGDILNPKFHEAVASLPAPHDEPGVILAETSPGFLRGEKLITPAKVVVAGPAEQTPDSAGRR